MTNVQDKSMEFNVSAFVYRLPLRCGNIEASIHPSSLPIDSCNLHQIHLNAASGNIGQAKTLTSYRVLIGRGLPTVPKSLFERIQRWEFIDLAELVPPLSVHDQMIDNQARFALFELIPPKRKQIESITQWTKAYTVYIAVLLQKFPEQANELLAYQHI